MLGSVGRLMEAWKLGTVEPWNRAMQPWKPNHGTKGGLRTPIDVGSRSESIFWLRQSVGKPHLATRRMTARVRSTTTMNRVPGSACDAILVLQ